MLESVRRSIGGRFARFHFRKSRDAAISFPYPIHSSATLLAVAPLHASEGTDIVARLLPLRDSFDEGMITIVADVPRHHIERALPRSHVITIKPEEVGRFFLPHKGLFARLPQRRYDVALDLNLDFLLPSAYICKESNAPLRAGFERQYADTFFNFLVRVHASSTQAQACDHLIACLHMFLAEKSV